jgi:uncharacterized protein YaiL (DUF2058 family)
VSKSLRDQLVASGLASTSQAKKAEKQARAESQARTKRPKNKTTNSATNPASKPEAATSAEPESRQLARKARVERSSRDQARARNENIRAANRAMRAEIRQILQQHDQRAKEAREDDVPYNFLHNKKIKRIYLPRGQVDQLSRDQLFVINDDGIYHLVNKEIADKISARDPSRLIAAKSDPAEDMDEFYKKFEVPDDLDW